LDYLTGPEISVPIYYLIPVSLAAWFGGGWVGVWVSIICAMTGLSIDLILRSSYSYPATPYWNTLARLGLFLIVSYILANLQAARRLREELQHFIVHDLGTPLGVIILALGALKHDTAALNETQRMLVERAWASSQWMSTLINSLLNLSRLESGHMPLQISEVELKELVELSLEQVALQAEQNQLTLATELNTDIERLCADRELTTRVLVNLLGNAIKVSPPGSVITVRVAPTEANMLAFSIADQGPGIPKQWIGKVFDKFAQIEARQAGAAVGSGLGLTFCKLAVEAQGGCISLESGSGGQGTTVTFNLPATTRRSIETHPVGLKEDNSLVT
jgi:signal transduction histidine kinase